MFHPNPLFSDGCVLCHGREIALFGEADDGARVTARLTGAEMPNAPAWHNKCCADTCGEN